MAFRASFQLEPFYNSGKPKRSQKSAVPGVATLLGKVCSAPFTQPSTLSSPHLDQHQNHWHHQTWKKKKTNPNTCCSGPGGSTSSGAYVALPCRETAVCPHMWPLTQGEDLGRRKMLSKPHGHLFMCCRMVTQPW